MRLRSKTIWILINLLGGAAVIGSYLYGFLTRSNASQVLWGDVPAGLKPFYIACMFVAAAGYLVLTYSVFRLDSRETRVGDRSGFDVYNILYLLVLVPSALWLPLTFQAIERSSYILRWMVRLDLVLVAIGSLGLLFAVLATRPRPPTPRYIPAVVGSVALCLQTVILDAIVWSFYFHG